jgi:hypothetical protein
MQLLAKLETNYLKEFGVFNLISLHVSKEIISRISVL